METVITAWRRVPDAPQEEVEAYAKQFQKRARFLVDESLGSSVAELLRAQGWNAKYVAEMNLKGHSDEDVFARAWVDDRIVLTHDSDFLDDTRFPPHRNPGVVVLPGAQGDEMPLLGALAGLASFVAPFREGYRRKKVVVSADGEWTFIGQNPETGRMEKRRLRIPPRGAMEEWIDE